MKKIGFLGGTFDPIHNGHVEIAKIAADSLGLDKVFFIPAALPPHKEGNYAENGVHRLNMAYLAAEVDERFEVTDYEFKREGKSYSYLTMEYFKELYSDATLYFILGDEAYAALDSWKHPERLKKVVEFIVVNRENIEFSGNVHSIKIPPIDISSTKIRALIKENKDAGSYLPQKVYDYILRNNLYR